MSREGFSPKPRVFISYARKDGEEFATNLRKRLEKDEPEITLWQDRAEMEGGVGWWKQIEEALDQVRFLVIVMTPAAMLSEMTRKEWRLRVGVVNPEPSLHIELQEIVGMWVKAFNNGQDQRRA